ncbi:preprotein translocase subunit YajC [Draconibacterium orientale]|jgi:preprotein translocase subunit YajC|uniref:Sec translocon accessory complex subunit YajC n=1 Tax=Draconibacterium orientale TaxID=1168034 RepID=X5DZN6_9BACT|nr:preprotein translocase subunit YajC [Draconibacterium orientale]AHW60710.1 preprotein translocase subunit YajC [Draconibacterium orientale]SEU01505.1 preprotein translocase subunit YajC [Draconibacterium orientale]
MLNSILLMMQPQEGAEANPLMSFLPLLLIIVVFYFFMIRPQMKRQKETRKFRESLQKGDKVVTTGGIYGKVVKIEETAIQLEVAKDVVIKVDKNGIVKDMSDVQPQK